MKNLNVKQKRTNHSTSNKISSLKLIAVSIWVVIAVGWQQMSAETDGVNIGFSNLSMHFQDNGNHVLHNGECHILEEQINQDGTFHVEFELAKETEFCFEMLNSRGKTIWRSPLLKDSPGHHEITWNVADNQQNFPVGKYRLAVDFDDEKVIIGELDCRQS